jgi:hypothetical protein
LPRSAIGLKHITRSSLAPLDQCVKLHLTDSAFFGRRRRASREQCIHFSLDQIEFMSPFLENDRVLHLALPQQQRIE